MLDKAFVSFEDFGFSDYILNLNWSIKGKYFDLDRHTMGDLLNLESKVPKQRPEARIFKNIFGQKIQSLAQNLNTEVVSFENNPAKNFEESLNNFSSITNQFVTNYVQDVIEKFIIDEKITNKTNIIDLYEKSKSENIVNIINYIENKVNKINNPLYEQAIKNFFTSNSKQIDEIVNVSLNHIVNTHIDNNYIYNSNTNNIVKEFFDNNVSIKTGFDNLILNYFSSLSKEKIEQLKIENFFKSNKNVSINNFNSYFSEVQSAIKNELSLFNEENKLEFVNNINSELINNIHNYFTETKNSFSNSKNEITSEFVENINSPLINNIQNIITKIDESVKKEDIKINNVNNIISEKFINQEKDPKNEYVTNNYKKEEKKHSNFYSEENASVTNNVEIKNQSFEQIVKNQFEESKNYTEEQIDKFEQNISNFIQNNNVYNSNFYTNVEQKINKVQENISKELKTELTQTRKFLEDFLNK